MAIHRVRLTEARLQHQWSQAELAARLGTTQANVSRWERGITTPTLYFRDRLCTLFGKSVQELDLERVPTSEVEVMVRDPAIPARAALRLVGRDEVLAGLKQRLRAPMNSGPLVVHGLPGVGKTALAISLAHDQEIHEQFSDGILWAGLGPDPDSDGILNHWSALLGLSEAETSVGKSRESVMKQLRAALAGRSLLLIIDDVWQAETALTFLLGGSSCVHIVTTRFPAIASQLTIDGAIALPELTVEASMDLLQALAPMVVAREAQKAQALVREVGGLPLALKLIGNYLRSQGYSAHPRRIQAALEKLHDASIRLRLAEAPIAREAHPGLPLHAALSLEAIIAVTDQHLAASSREAFYALSTLPAKPHTFSEEAALAVAACTGETLDALGDAGLLESGGEGRYMLHQLIVDYAQAHLHDPAPRERLISYALAFIEAHKTDYGLLVQDCALILAALDSAHESGRGRELMRGVYTFAPFLILRSNYVLAERHVRRAYDVALALEDRDGMSYALYYLGRLAQNQNDYSQALNYFREGLSLARATGNLQLICDLLQGQARAHWTRGEYTEAEVCAQEGLTLARQIEYREGIVKLLSVLAGISYSLGNYGQTRLYAQEGLGRARQIGDQEALCYALAELGTIVVTQGNYSEGAKYMQEALALARQLGHYGLIRDLLTNLGFIAFETQEYGQARACFQEGLAVARKIGIMHAVCTLLVGLARVATYEGHYREAVCNLQECLSAIEPLGEYALVLCECWGAYGDLYLRQGELAAAEDAFQRMLAAVPEGYQELYGLAQYGLAQVALAQSNGEQARVLVAASIALLEPMGHHKLPEMKRWQESIGSQG